jgi:hypothetical protein
MIVVANMIGNPIGSFWSMLTRHELISRANRTALSFPLSRETARDIATIAATCDEYGWYNPLSGILKALQNRTENSAVPLTDDDGNGVEPTKPNNHVGHGDQNAHLSLLESEEKYFLVSARHSIISHRNDSHLGTWFAILGLIAALGAAFIKVWTNRNQPFSSRPIPMVILTFFLLPMVQISSNIGGFTSVFGPLLAIQELQKKLQERYSRTSRIETERLTVWLSLDLNDIDERIFTERRRIREAPILDTHSISAWLKIAPYSGMNSTWRPDKLKCLEETTSDQDRSPRMLLLYSIGFVSISCVMAILHSFFTVGHFGFGCRCLTWTMIFITWLISPCIDQLLRCRIFRIKSCTVLWHCTVIKDTILAIAVVMAITVVHIGMTGTCYCYTGTLSRHPSNHNINLWPLEGKQLKWWWFQLVIGPTTGLFLTCFLLFWVQYESPTMRTILSPSQDDRHEMQL